MLMLLRLLALLLVLAGAFWVYQRWQPELVPPTAVAVPEKGTYRGAADTPLPKGQVEELQQRALGQRF
jgi:hypothetical protein